MKRIWLEIYKFGGYIFLPFLSLLWSVSLRHENEIAFVHVKLLSLNIQNQKKRKQGYPGVKGLYNSNVIS